MDDVRLRVIKALNKRRVDLKTASLSIGRNHAYLQQFLYTGTPKVLPEDVRIALAKFLGINQEKLRHKVRPARKSAERVARPIPEQVPPGAKEFVPIYSLKPEGGGGADGRELSTGRAEVFLPRRVVDHELKARAKELRVFAIEGDAMVPELNDGDRVIVDLARTSPVPPGLFVIKSELGFEAKHLELLPNSEPPLVRIRSLNAAYEPYERLNADIRIVGRIRWRLGPI